MKTTIEYFHLLTITQYFNRYEDLRTFCLINHKCKEVIHTMKKNPYCSIQQGLMNFFKMTRLLEGLNTVYCDISIFKQFKEFEWEKFQLFHFDNLKSLKEIERWMINRLSYLKIQIESPIPSSLYLENVREIEIEYFQTISNQKQNEIIQFLNTLCLNYLLRKVKIISNTNSIDSLISVLKEIDKRIRIRVHVDYLLEIQAKQLKETRDDIVISYESTNSLKTNNFATHLSSFFHPDYLLNQEEFDTITTERYCNSMNFIGKREIIKTISANSLLKFPQTIPLLQLHLFGISFSNEIVLYLPSSLKKLSVNCCDNIDFKVPSKLSLDEYQLDGCQTMKTIKLFNSKTILLKSISQAIEIVDDWCDYLETLEINSLYSLQRLYLPSTLTTLKISFTSLKRIYNLKQCKLERLLLVNNSELNQKIELQPTLKQLGISQCPFFSIVNMNELKLDSCTLLK